MPERFARPWERGRTALILLLVCLALTACSKGKEVIPPVEALLTTGETAWEKKKWSKAAETYGRIRDYYPYHTQATMAQFRAAEALYRDKRYAEALAAMETFDELHPTHQERARVLLRIGQCHFRLSRGIDRDQSETEKAVKALQRVSKLFPGTPQDQEAQKLLFRAYRKLVRHELYVGRYYRRTKAFEAAIGRFKKALEYPDVGYNQILEAELQITEALAQGKRRPRIKVPPEPKEDRSRWWKIWD
jgi:outer membrane protein assembly factor BamD